MSFPITYKAQSSSALYGILITESARVVSSGFTMLVGIFIPATFPLTPIFVEETEELSLSFADEPEFTVGVVSDPLSVGVEADPLQEPTAAIKTSNITIPTASTDRNPR